MTNLWLFCDPSFFIHRLWNVLFLKKKGLDLEKDQVIVLYHRLNKLVVEVKCVNHHYKGIPSINTRMHVDNLIVDLI